MSAKREPCKNADGSSKRAFFRSTDARQYARNVKKRFPGDGKQHVYSCGCGFYHLTTKPMPRGRSVAA